jgi:hypothetical protein
VGENVNWGTVIGLFIVFTLMLVCYGAAFGAAVLVFRWVVNHG